jgi:hypothetical protein
MVYATVGNPGNARNAESVTYEFAEAVLGSNPALTARI